MNAHLFSILYAPYRYAHPEHRQLRGFDLAQLAEPLANQWLIEHWALPNDMDFDFDRDPEVATCVQWWAHLRRICYLIGVLRLRSPIIEQAWYPKLDALARQFLQVPAPALPAAESPLRLEQADIYAAGSAGFAAVFRRMPAALRLRLPLLFPAHAAERVTSQLRAQEDTIVFPPFVFSLAHRYALDPRTSIS
ncbi:type III secretion apparatus protein OrgA/MxiK [Burkholderia ambifaria IOP40-10]|uniref:Type III secretion apparatus protein OrgA/MxiK n=1 Tax=Burkholderia ambifaria IOP40-10 TaxID=396596 RepID=B1FB91_9BURK|nr:type III secretion apparatus protein OrgA/MxiK [Burkholderia ambifaria]EDT05173.1 type III secretion apparatus protein OrgA/MxiK [Burkholderia ambifaria IOP40-10]